MRQTNSRRVIRRLRYDDNGSTVDVTTVTTVRPTRTPPPIPGILTTPPPSPAPTLTSFPISDRFIQTIARAAQLVEQDHPLQNAAEALTSMGHRTVRRRLHFMGSVRSNHTMQHEKIIYDIVKVDSTKKIKDTDKCPICLSEYEEGEDCGLLPCKHSFHDLCLRTWTNTNRTCPLCRLELG